MVVVSFRPFAKRVHSTNVNEEKPNKQQQQNTHTHTYTRTHRESVRLFPKKKQTIKILGY